MEAQLRTLLEQQIEAQNQRIAELRVEQQQMFAKIMSVLEKDKDSNDVGENQINTSEVTGDRNVFKFLPKIEFPNFGGANPRIWIKKCARYFSLCKIPDSQKVDLASIHLTGKAEIWFASYIAVKKSVEWDDFIVDVCDRFREELRGTIVEEFNKLQQVGSLDDYLDSFEELKSMMIQKTPCLPDDFFIDSFVGGLKPQLKPFVKALRPTTLSEAVVYARLQEETIEAMKPHGKAVSPMSSKAPILPTYRPGPYQSSLPNSGSGVRTATSSSSLVGSSASVNKPYTQSFKPTRVLSAAERAEKSAKGLCYFCDQPYTRGHQCQNKKTQLFLVEIPDTDQEEPQEGEEEAIDFEVLEADPCISLHALNGIQGYQAMRVTGHYGKKPIHILVDSGSTHNFLDINLAKRLGCKLEGIDTQSVTVADGNELRCQFICKNFPWKLQGADFWADMFLIPLGSCDMVLGIQWLSTLGTIKWNFKHLTMEFKFQGHNHVLRGLRGKKVKVIKETQLHKAMHNAAHLCMLQLLPRRQHYEDTQVTGVNL